MYKPILALSCAVMVGSLSGCIGAAAMTAIGTAASVAGIAKDVFDVDVSIHSLFGQGKPSQPIPPADLIAHPHYLVVNPDQVSH